MSEPLIVVMGNTVVVYDLNGAELLRFDHPQAEVTATKLKDWSLRIVSMYVREAVRETQALRAKKPT